MLKNSRWFKFGLIIIVCAMSFLAGIAVQQNRSQSVTGSSGRNDSVVIANRFLDQLEAAYNTWDIPFIVSLYDDPAAGIDITQDDNRFYTAPVLRKEFEKAIKGGNLTGIKCAFTNREVSASGNMIMIRTLRTVTANELPKKVNCLLLLILREKFTHGQFDGCVITSQILLKEEYVSQ